MSRSRAIGYIRWQQGLILQDEGYSGLNICTHWKSLAYSCDNKIYVLLIQHKSCGQVPVTLYVTATRLFFLEWRYQTIILWSCSPYSVRAFYHFPSDIVTKPTKGKQFLTLCSITWQFMEIFVENGIIPELSKLRWRCDIIRDSGAVGSFVHQVASLIVSTRAMQNTWNNLKFVLQGSYYLQFYEPA